MPLSDAVIKEILSSAKIIAVVGLSEKPGRASLGVSRYLQREGYRIIPVNPLIKEVLGEKAVPNLASLPVPVDIVDVFRNAAEVPGVVEEVLKLNPPPKLLWLQEGVANLEAEAKAEAAGIPVVSDRCLFKEHARLFA